MPYSSVAPEQFLELLRNCLLTVVYNLSLPISVIFVLNINVTILTLVIISNYYFARFSNKYFNGELYRTRSPEVSETEAKNIPKYPSPLPEIMGSCQALKYWVATEDVTQGWVEFLVVTRA